MVSNNSHCLECGPTLIPGNEPSWRTAKTDPAPPVSEPATEVMAPPPAVRDAAEYERSMAIIQLTEALFATDDRIRTLVASRPEEDPEEVIGDAMLRHRDIWCACWSRAEAMLDRMPGAGE